MIQCTHCRYFDADASNPTAAMGRCMHNARHGYWHANQSHPCDDFSIDPSLGPRDAPRQERDR